MKMEVLVGVDVVEGKTSCTKRIELRSDLPCQLTSNSRQKEKPGSSSCHIRIERTARTHEIWYLFWRQNGKTVDKNEM
jgi:hypothetical protein